MAIRDATITDDLAREWDYIVVGGGSAGAVISRRLAEDGCARVLLIEAGPADHDIAEILDPSRWVGLGSGPLDHGYSYAPAIHANGQRIPIPRGKVLGGCSSTNAMLWYRGHASDYDRWAEDGASGWDFAAVLPYFRRCEDWEGGATSLRGAGGPLRIERSHDPHPVACALLDAASELGFSILADGNGPNTEGASLANLTIADGKRCSASWAYLRPAQYWPNLTILTNSTVDRLVLEGTKCVGVVHELGQEHVTTRARCEVILSAGAIDSPRLLMLSGIGPADELRRLDIPTAIDLRGVGRNLQDHPLLKGMNFEAREPLGALRDQGGGAMMNWRSTQAGPDPDLHTFIGQRPHASPETRAAYDVPDNCFSLSPGLMGSHSRGYLRMLDRREGGTLEIQPNFLADPRDLAALSDAVEMIFDMSATTAFRRLALRPVTPDRRLDKQGREAFIRLALSTFFHACGTCAMGTGPLSVTDPQLRVRGTTGLRVVDASVIPTIPSCNTHAPVVMIAERAADIIRGIIAPIANIQRNGS